MPSPPTGDIACAASPIARYPGRCQRVRRSTRTVSSLTSSQLRMAPTRSASSGATRTMSCLNASRPRDRRKRARMPCHELEEIPLWHEGDERKLRGHALERHTDGLSRRRLQLDRRHFAVRELQEFVGEPEFVEQFERRGMDGVAAEI